MITNIEKLVYESIEEINKVACKDNYNKTDCLNAQYHSGRIHACMDMLESIDFDRFVSLYDEIHNILDKSIEIVECIYH